MIQIYHFISFLNFELKFLVKIDLLLVKALLAKTMRNLVSFESVFSLFISLLKLIRFHRWRLRYKQYVLLISTVFRMALLLPILELTRKRFSSWPDIRVTVHSENAYARRFDKGEPGVQFLTIKKHLVFLETCCKHFNGSVTLFDCFVRRKL